jgi:hypothetical protein
VAEAVDDALAPALAEDDPLPRQGLKVSGRAGLGEADFRGQLGDAPRPAVKDPDDPKPGGVADTCHEALQARVTFHCMAVHTMSAR